MRKTAEELANEKYYDIPYPENIASVDDYTTNEIRLLQRIAYVAGYNEAMRWRDPKEELPEEDGLYLCKCKSNRLGFYFEVVFFNKVWRSDNVIGWRPIE